MTRVDYQTFTKGKCMDHLVMWMTKTIHGENKVTCAKMAQLLGIQAFLNSSVTHDYD